MSGEAVGFLETELRQIQLPPGHASTKTTEIYTRITRNGEEKFWMIWNCNCACIYLHYESHPLSCKY